MGIDRLVDAAESLAGDVLLWADTRAGRYVRDVVGGPLSVQGFAPHKVLPFVRRSGGADSPGRTRGPLLPCSASLRTSTRAPGGLLEPVDYLADA